MATTIGVFMKIAFNKLQCGLGNNGGTRTIILCSKVLAHLGHTCDIVAKVDNFTWFKHRPIIPKFPKDLDVAIATACTTVHSTLKSNARIKAWYIRAHENWAMSDHKLAKLYNSKIINIVNSKGLQKKLSSYGADSKVIYQGIDFDWWNNRKLRPKNKIRIGCLHTKQPGKRWKDFVKLHKILGIKKYEYVGMGSARPNDNFLTDFKLNANVEELNNLYSSCHIWFAPTENEGLHNVPMEAALCGCLIVCSDHTSNGMVNDYAFIDSAMIYKFGDLDHAATLIKNPEWYLTKKMWARLKMTIGSREENMLELVKIFERNK